MEYRVWYELLCIVWYLDCTSELIMLEGKYSLGVGQIDKVHFSGIFWVILHNCLIKYCINWVDSTQI